MSPSSRRAWIEIRCNADHATHRHVALLAEGVDRNRSKVVCTALESMSPSSRRAWIEIVGGHHLDDRPPVALLAEGVDRNRIGWMAFRISCVALLAEGVDRNIYWAYITTSLMCRPPRGGRG